MDAQDMLTYGEMYSTTLLKVCFRIIMVAIWIKRSVMHPLGWHCKEERD